jgi:hypothetical protein
VCGGACGERQGGTGIPGDSIEDIEDSGTYKYLGIDQLFGINLTSSKNRVMAELFK